MSYRLLEYVKCVVMCLRLVIGHTTGWRYYYYIHETITTKKTRLN